MASSSSSLPLFLRGAKGVFVLYDYSVSCIAILLNLLILVSLARTRIHLTGYKYFLVSLSVSDLYLGITNLTIIISHAILQGSAAYDFDESNTTRCVSHAFRCLQMIGFLSNLFNLCGMSYDHLIGIVYPLNYHRFMRKRHLRWIVFGIWATAFFIGTADVPVTTYMYLNYLDSEPLMNNQTKATSPSVFSDVDVSDNCRTLQASELPIISSGDVEWDPFKNTPTSTPVSFSPIYSTAADLQLIKQIPQPLRYVLIIHLFSHSSP